MALDDLRERLKEIPQADERRLQELKTELLGRKAGALTEILKSLPTLDADTRRQVGAAANALKRELERAIEERERELKQNAAALSGVDLTMPGRPQWRGGGAPAPHRLARHQSAVSSLVLPVHRAIGRDGRAMPDLRRLGLRRVQADRLDGNPRLRHGASRGARELQRRQREIHRLRLGHGSRAHRDAAAWHSRHPAVLRQRRAILGTVPMIVSRRWLEALLSRPLQGRDVADRLARQVAPVDAVIPIHQDLRDVVVARVLEVKQHPNADRLSLCQVDAGSGAPLEVVCGAPNVQAGKAYPFAPVGAVLPGGLKLERRKIRGVESNGMLCSAKELGLGVDHAGILELDTAAPPGTPFLEAIPIADEQIVIDVSANRPDLLCHKGVARELAVSLGATVKLPTVGRPDGPTATAGPKAVRPSGRP